MRTLFLTAILLPLVTPYSFASIAPLQEYVIIENQIDNEIFIAANITEPDFTGSNVFMKYLREGQYSLGYMGYRGTPFTPAYRRGDIWLENSPVNQPFVGNRCMTNDSNCPATSYWSAQQLRDNGAYKIEQTGVPGQSGFSRPVFSESFYQWLVGLPAGTSYTFDLRTCTSTADYDLNKTTCINSGGEINTQQHTIPTVKKGHLTFKKTSVLQEIFVDSNGNPSVGLGSDLCHVGVVSNVTGLICDVVEFNAKGSSLSGTFSFRMGIDYEKLGLPTYPSANAIQYKAKNSTVWRGWSIKGNVTELFRDNSESIEVFLSNSFLKSIVDASPDSAVTLADNIYTFSFQSSLQIPDIYKFTPSNYLVIKPKNYGISIIPADFNPVQSKTGKIGNDEPPIEFNYIVTTSGLRQADSITAKVEGPNVQLKGQSFCLFSSDDDKFKVPFSAYLLFKNETGSDAMHRASCDGNEISLKNAYWEEVPWDVPNQDLGAYYRTNLDLIFPMNEQNSSTTLDGIDWLGTVSASGQITVKAIWMGADIH